MSSFLPFAMPDIGEEELSEVVETIKKGWLTTGPKTKQFEVDFSEFVGGGEAIAVNSATAGLHLALEALGITEGDEVITTVHTFTATAEVIRYLGADPVFVDIEPHTLNIDPAKIEKVVTSKTKAIIPVHFGGLACAMDAIFKIAQKHGLKIVEDAAHALPTTYKGKLIGTLDSDATVYSFYATKTITTGEGGMIVTKNSDIANRCRTMRLHGINRDVFERYTSSESSWYYEVIAPGFKYNMTDLAASIGIHQLKKAFIFQSKRANLALRYNSEFADFPITLPALPRNGDMHAWHLYVIRLKDARFDRDSFMKEMFSKGVGCSVHFIPLHLHPYWKKKYGFKPEDFPVATSEYYKSISLPLYTKMTETDQDRVINVVRSLVK